MDTNENHGFASSHKNPTTKPHLNPLMGPVRNHGKKGPDVKSQCISYIFRCPCIHEEKRDSCSFVYLGVSKNMGTPKWMVYTGKPY